jgi:hypothetical protein
MATYVALSGLQACLCFTITLQMVGIHALNLQVAIGKTEDGG